MKWVLACLPLLACQAQPTIPPELSLLARIKTRMAETLGHLPNYTCTQTTERSQKRPAARAFDVLDNVRLEVALVGGKELFGWPGANRIDEAELGDLIGGTFGNGNFALLARSVFLTTGPTFAYAGESEQSGPRAVRFNFRVPLLYSGYHLKVTEREAVVGYHGSFWADPETLDLLRLEVFADDIPPRLGLAASSTATNYKRARIGASEFVLPESSDLILTELNGIEHRNRTRFHDCRQYSGESVLTFADPSPREPALVQKDRGRIELPDDLVSEFSLITPIDSQTSAVGDAVQARLYRAIKVDGRVTAPKSALLNGRITRLQKAGHYYVISIALASLDAGDDYAELSGRDNQLSPLLLRPSPSYAMSRTQFADTLRQEMSKGSMVFETNRLVLKPGFPLVLRSRLLKSE